MRHLSQKVKQHTYDDRDTHQKPCPKVRNTHALNYLRVFVEVLGRPVLDVRLRGGLSQGELWEDATAGARHHVPGISAGLKLGAGSEVLRLTGGDTEERGGNTKCQSSLLPRTFESGELLSRSEGAGWD